MLTLQPASALIATHFPELTLRQKSCFQQLGSLYQYWNARINVISRRDIHNLYLHHILHSLSIAKVIQFRPDAQILDWGTGGGLPGIPLAILFPEVHFTLVDSIGKKIKVVQEIIKALGLQNVNAVHTRAETLQHHYDFITGRSVSKLTALYQLLRDKIIPLQQHTLPNGLLYLRGKLDEDLTALRANYTLYPLSDHFDHPFFIGRQLVHLFPLQP